MHSAPQAEALSRSLRLFRALPLNNRKPRRICAVAADLNPQNVPDPLVLPQPGFTAEEAVRVQLEALQNNDDPWFNHGIQTAYEFGEDIGGMERSRYFGYSKDLYHFDHFLGQFQNAFPVLIKADSFDIEGTERQSEDCFDIIVSARKGSAKCSVQFHMLRKSIGRKKGSLMTKSITHLR